MLSDRMDGDDVRMAEPGDGVGLGLEPLALVRGRESALGDRLDRHDAVELQVAGLVNDAHAAAAQHAHDLEAIDDFQGLIDIDI